MEQRLPPLRWRIVLAWLVVLLPTLALLTVTLLAITRATYLRTLEEGTAGQARLVAQLVLTDQPQLRASDGLVARVRALQQQLGARVTLITPDGQPVADSREPPVTDNLRQRPEVQTALASGQGVSGRSNTATGEDWFYVAVPIGDPHAPLGVARVGVPLATIGEAQTRVVGAMVATALLAALVALVLATALARRVTQPLVALQRLADQVALGDRAVQMRAEGAHEIVALANSFNQMVERLRAAEHGRRTLLANITHDLRTPLASLQAMIDTLEDGALDDRPAAADFLRRMAIETASLNKLVDEFLELMRIESGELALHPAPTDVPGLLRSVAQRMELQAHQRGVGIMVAGDPQLPPVSLDPQRIEQVLLNLVQNALQWTPAGGIITLTAARVDDTVAIAVRDTGEGIAPDDLPHIFERFYKVDRARSSDGTGLGLAIVRHLVERHGGRVSATSTVGIGTTITFSLPLDSPPADENVGGVGRR
jgi:signal transduction histidine kinase